MAARRTDGVNAVGMNRALLAGLIAVTAVTIALSVWLGAGLSDQHAVERRRQDILAAARQSALNFTSLDYRHYGRDTPPRRASGTAVRTAVIRESRSAPISRANHSRC
ncbi:hypothetical protein ACWDAZ_36790, partial [Streptomyces sp. NPDC001215]